VKIAQKCMRNSPWSSIITNLAKGAPRVRETAPLIQSNALVTPLVRFLQVPPHLSNGHPIVKSPCRVKIMLRLPDDIRGALKTCWNGGVDREYHHRLHEVTRDMQAACILSPCMSLLIMTSSEGMHMANMREGMWW
jgi:hypothetical protein